MGCIEQLDYELIAKGITISECEKYIRNNCDEIFTVNSGYKIFGDIFLFGSTNIPIGIYNDKIILPFIKPCFGIFLVKLDGGDEIYRLRNGAYPSNHDFSVNNQRKSSGCLDRCKCPRYSASKRKLCKYFRGKNRHR